MDINDLLGIVIEQKASDIHFNPKEDGIVVFEDENEWQKEVEGLVVVDKRKYGRAHLTFFKEKK